MTFVDSERSNTYKDIDFSKFHSKRIFSDKGSSYTIWIDLMEIRPDEYFLKVQHFYQFMKRSYEKIQYGFLDTRKGCFTLQPSKEIPHFL
jgi:hypothetical protein